MQSFGDRLKKEREKRGVTLEDVSLSTKIGVRLLRALEEERFELLPGGIFNKGFVRAYAHHLGIDEDEAVADYLAAAGQQAAPVETVLLPQPPEIHAPAEAPPEIESSAADRIPWGKLAFVLLLVAFGFAIWGSFSRQDVERHRQSVASAASKGAASSPNAEAVPKGTEVAVPNSPANNGEQAASSANEPAAQEAAAAPFTVLIQARQESWVEITADGKPVMQDTMAASEQKAVEARREIVVKAGNIGGLEFSFNGKKLPAQGDRNEVKVLTFDPQGLQTPVSRKPQAEGPNSRPQA